MANFMQIVEINSQGSKSVYHPETDADYVLEGKRNKVPTIVNIEDWIARSTELVAARKGEPSLKAKIDIIDNALVPKSLLEALKKVDGEGSGLDADTVDGRTVNDGGATSSDLWTANKVKLELDKKLNADQVTSTAQANKVLRLNSTGLLDTSITKNAATSTRLQNPLAIKLQGDISGGFTFNGSEKSLEVNVEILDNSHNHSGLTAPNAPVSLKSTAGERVADFYSAGQVVSHIDSEGTYNGNSTSVNGYRVNNDVSTGRALWSAGKIVDEIEIGSLKVVEQELFKYTDIEEESATIGPFRFFKGSVDISSRATVELQLPLEELKIGIFNESYVMNSATQGITYSRVPNSNTFIFSKIPEAGATLSWSIIGV